MKGGFLWPPFFAMIHNKKYNILIIEDHPLIVEGYKTILSYCSLGNELNIEVAYNCEVAYNKITQYNLYDLIFIDFSLPSYSEKNINSGIDLAYIILNKTPHSKIIFITAMTDIFTLYEIKNKINPNGILIKSDLSTEEFIQAIESIVKNQIFYSKSVKKDLNEFLTLNNNLFLDMYNRKLILLLADRLSSKSISTKLNLSISAIEKRKKNIKLFFNIQNGTDEDIVLEAKKRNLI